MEIFKMTTTLSLLLLLFLLGGSSKVTKKKEHLCLVFFLSFRCPSKLHLLRGKKILLWPSWYLMQKQSYWGFIHVCVLFHRECLLSLTKPDKQPKKNITGHISSCDDLVYQKYIQESTFNWMQDQSVTTVFKTYLLKNCSF